MDEPTVYGISFVVVFVVALVVMLILSPYWYSFATNTLPQLPANKVAAEDDKSEGDTEKGEGEGGAERQSDKNSSERRREKEREKKRERELERERSRKPQKLVDVKLPSLLASTGIDFKVVFSKMSRDRIWTTLSMASSNDQHVTLLQSVVEAMSTLTADYLNQKLILLLCCMQISLRQLSRAEEKSHLRDDEGKILNKLLKVAKRLKSAEDAEVKDLEMNFPKIIEAAKTADPKRAEEARDRLIHLNIQRRFNFIKLLVTLQEHYRQELQARVDDWQTEHGMAIVFVLMMQGEHILNTFIRKRLLAIIDRNSGRFANLLNRASSNADADKTLLLNQQAFTEALDYVYKPRAARAATVQINPTTQQEPPQILSEQERKDLAQQYASELQKPLQQWTAGRVSAKDKSAFVDERLELLYVETLGPQLEDKEELLSKADSQDPTDFGSVYESLIAKHEDELVKLWKKADSLEFEEFTRIGEEEVEQLQAKLKSATQTFVESKMSKREDQREIMDAFLYHLEKIRNRERLERRQREPDGLKKFSDARERLEEKQVSLFLEMSTNLFRRSIRDMMEVNLILEDEAREKTKTELEYCVCTVWSHVILTKFELEQRLELALKPEQIKFTAAKEAKRAELASKSQAANEKLTDQERVAAIRKQDEELTAAMKADLDKLAASEKREVLRIRDEVIKECESVTLVLQKQICVSVGRYMASSARLDNEETSADLDHDLLDAVLKRVAQNASEAGAQAERLLQEYQRGVIDSNDKLDTQRDSRADRIIEVLNRRRFQKEAEIDKLAERQAQMIGKLPDSYTGRQFAKLLIQEKVDRERNRVGREAMRAELLRERMSMDKKKEEDSKYALQLLKKQLLIRLASLCNASHQDIKRYAEAGAADLPLDPERRKKLVSKLVSEFRHDYENANKDY